MKEVSLSSLMPGDRATVQRISKMVPQTRQRLLEMGLVRGASIELIRFAPLGDPIEVNLGGYRLSLRQIEAEAIIVRRDI